MATKKGIYSKTDGDHCTLMYNGQKVCDRMFGGVTQSGIYVNGSRLELYGNVIAKSSRLSPRLCEKNGSLMFGEVDLVTNGKCINISLSDFNRLLAGESVNGYKAYSPDDVYNVIPENGFAEELTYTESNGVYTFSNGATAPADNKIVYNNARAMTPNTEDLVETVMNTDCPQIYVRYFDPIIAVGDTIEIEYHVDDITMSALNYDKVEDTFTVIIKTASGSTTSRTTYAGMYKLTTPAFNTAGETWFSIRCIDSNGVSSIEQFFDVLVKTSLEVVDKPYTMTTDDLDFTYNDVAYHIVPEDSTVSVAIANKAAFSAFFAKVKAEGYNRVILLNRTYWIDYHQKNGQPIVAANQKYLGGDYIKFPDHFTVDLNGATLRATQCTDLALAELVILDRNVDTHIINGNLMGNYTGFDFATTQATLPAYKSVEEIAVLSFRGSRYCTAENLNVSDAVGFDCTFQAVDTNVGRHLDTIGITDNKRVDLATGTVIDTNNMVVTGTFGVSAGECIAFGRNGTGKYLNLGTQREIFYSFYGTGGVYLGSLKSKFYGLVRVPANATSARITGYGKTLASGASNDTDWCYDTNLGQVMVFRPKLNINTIVKNCNWSHTRTIAITNPCTNGLLIEGCTYTDIAIEEAYATTSALADFEDNWNWGNNVAMRNCSCVKGDGENHIIFHYINGFEFSNNKGISFTSFGGLEAGYIHDNTMPSIYWELNRSCYHPFVLFDNNVISSLSISYGTWKWRPNPWTIAYAEEVVSMINSTIRTKCYYAKLKLRNSKNGNDVIN